MAHKSDLQREYDKLLALRDDNEKRLRDIEIKENQLNSISEAAAELDRMKGVLQNYVKC